MKSVCSCVKINDVDEVERHGTVAFGKERVKVIAMLSRTTVDIIGVFQTIFILELIKLF